MENLLDKIDNIVIKVGTKAITTDNSISSDSIENLARTCRVLVDYRKKVSIVTSGAIASGRRVIKDWKSTGTAEKQMLAAVGQPYLMQEYIRIFNGYNLNVAQFLLSKMDFENTEALERLRTSFNVTLDRRIIPIINENDPVETHEIKFSDNDELQALIVGKLGADLAINLITYDGLLKDGKVVDIARIYNALYYDGLNKEVKEGRGGLQGKLNAMQTIVGCRKYGIIGNVKRNIADMIKGVEIHTRFYPYDVAA